MKTILKFLSKKHLYITKLSKKTTKCQTALNNSYMLSLVSQKLTNLFNRL